MTYLAAYRRAQLALAELKTAVLEVLAEEHGGLTNAEIGRALGIYGINILASPAERK